MPNSLVRCRARRRTLHSFFRYPKALGLLMAVSAMSFFWS
jgi:hypothetical protein